MVTFIHTADWQIGRPFGSFDERKRTLLREARLTVIDRIAEAARSHRAAWILVAGDVFDSSTVADQLLRQTMARLAKHAPLVWHLLPGNHDPLRPGGVWERLSRIGAPENVVVHTKREAHKIGERVMLLPSPLSGIASSHDPSAWMDGAVTPPGMVRIGLAHGSVRGFGSDGQASQLIDPARVRSANLAYLALGDWHGAMRISDRVWYSGTPEPDRFRDNEPGFVLAVTVDETSSVSLVEVERVPVAHFAWVEHDIIVEHAGDWDRYVAQIGGGVALPVIPIDQQLTRLVLRGVLTLGERLRVEQGLADLEPRHFHLEVDLENLHERAGDDDLAALSDDGVRAIAQQLQVMIAEGDETARHALRKLIRLDRQLVGSPTVGEFSSRGGA